MNFEYLSENFVNSIFKILEYRNTDQEEFYKTELDNDLVVLKLYSYGKTYTYKFFKYIPKKISFLSGIFIIIFNNLPRKLDYFLYKLHAELESDVARYEYKNEFSFDLFSDDVSRIFEYQIRIRGEQYYKDNRVKFLEKIDDDRYFAIVEGTEKYLVVIKNNEKAKKIQVYCSCPCEFYCKHIYAVMIAIRNNDFKRFYKISYKNPNSSALEKILNFDYQLCLGIIENNFEIINDDGEIELIPIFDSNGKCNWQVLEDDENMSLNRLLQDIIHNS